MRAIKWSKINKLTPPTDTLSWLSYEGSSTKMLESLNENNLKIKMLSNDWGVADADECEQLGIDHDTPCLIREIYMMTGDTVWMYCRSIFPKAVIEQSRVDFEHLDNTPLGKILFAEKAWQRSPFDIAKLTASHPLYQKTAAALSNPPSTLWARRSCFRHQDLSILITEVLTPALFTLGLTDVA